ncbi:MAG: ferrochelatase [Geodermatophilaceae bacterium]|nr:ferrochelatase [Geodermatophilaceae bacterium]
MSSDARLVAEGNVASAPYGALLLLSFGGPDGPNDVLPFLENVTRGRGIPRERLLGVAEHYYHFGGVSPINAQNQALVAALRAELDGRGFRLPIYWGNRNWEPYVEDVIIRMTGDGVRRTLAIPTSAYSSYSACRQYWEDIARGRAAAGPDAPTIDKVRHFFNHPGFITANADALRVALAAVPPGSRVVYTAHSIPVAMAESSGPAALDLHDHDGGLYVRELRETAALVTAAVDPSLAWDLVWQSRSGPPSVPWLDPDVNDHLTTLAAAGLPGVALAPIGFVSDHIEVLWDLDTEASQTAASLGLPFARAATAGTHPAFVSALVDLVAERSVPGCPARALGSMGPSHDVCPVGCCPPPRRP